MNLKYFEQIEGEWTDISGQPGASLEYSADVSGWVATGGYKKYIAQITQSSSDAPTAIVLENTLGFAPTWEYNSSGVYGFDWDVDFDSSKCLNYLSPTNNGRVIWIQYNDAYDITLKSDGGDDLIYQTTLEIRYYN